LIDDDTAVAPQDATAEPDVSGTNPVNVALDAFAPDGKVHPCVGVFLKYMSNNAHNQSAASSLLDAQLRRLGLECELSESTSDSLVQ
jgi:hypothetical protein